jgi:TfoX/Sxy family transcriptional regulator of competence genes
MTATLLERVRALLPAGRSVREVRMFGGLSLMLDERMLVSVRQDSLLVRVDPDRSAELLGVEGAEPAAMGTHRSMGPGWITVSGAAVSSDEQLACWLQVALDHHSGATA